MNDSDYSTTTLPLLFVSISIVVTFLVTRLIRAGKGPFKDNVPEDGVHVRHVIFGEAVVRQGGDATSDDEALDALAQGVDHAPALVAQAARRGREPGKARALRRGQVEEHGAVGGDALGQLDEAVAELPPLVVAARFVVVTTHCAGANVN